MPPPLPQSKFFQFHAFLGKFGKIVRWYPTGALALLPRRHPGSTTVNVSLISNTTCFAILKVCWVTDAKRRVIFHTGRARLIRTRSIRSSTLFEVSVKAYPIISCSKCTVNSYFHLFQRKSLPTNDFELTVSDLY